MLVPVKVIVPDKFIVEFVFMVTCAPRVVAVVVLSADGELICVVKVVEVAFILILSVVAAVVLARTVGKLVAKVEVVEVWVLVVERSIVEESAAGSVVVKTVLAVDGKPVVAVVDP